MANMLNFKFGQYGNLPATKAAGTVYVTTDEQAMYIDLPKSHEAGAEVARVRIGDIIVKNSKRDAIPPFAEGAFYYFAEENALLRWDGSKWKQINSVSDVQANIASLQEELDAEVLRSTTADATHSADIAQLKKDVAARVTTADFETFKGANNTAIAAAKQAGLDASAEAKAAQAAADDAQDAADDALEGLTTKLDLAGGTMKGAINMGTYKITNLGTPANDGDAATKKYVDDAKTSALNAADAASKAAAAAQKKADEAFADAGEAQGTADGAMERANEAYALAETKTTMQAVLDKGYATVTQVNNAKDAVIGTESDKKTDITVRGAHAAAKAASDEAKLAQETADSKIDLAGVQSLNYATKPEAQGYASAVRGNTSETVATAFAKATNALSKAEEGVEDAAEALAAAEKAQETADSAVTAAGQADVKAANAATAAEEAKKAAKAADDNAKTRVLTADFEAFKTANTNAINAAAALADAAQDTADGAVTAAGLAQEAADKAQERADAAYELAGDKLDLTGGTMSGEIKMGTNKISGLATPTDDADAANKKYVDDTVKTVADNLETLSDEVDTVSGVATAAMPKAGGTFKGAVTMGTGATLTVLDPSAEGHAANKKYVDAAIAAGIKANDAMTFKGTVGTGGTVTSLPTTAQKGDTYKVSTKGTYAGVAAKVGDLFINVAADDATASWTHISSGYEDDYLQKLAVDGATIHLTDGVSNNASGSVGGIKFQGANTSNIVMKVTAGTGENPVHVVEASMVWGEF